MIKIGGGKIKTSKKGNEYISVWISKELWEGGFKLTDKHFLSLHQNTSKEAENQPDYVLCASLAEEEKEQNT